MVDSLAGGVLPTLARLINTFGRRPQRCRVRSCPTLSLLSHLGVVYRCGDRMWDHIGGETAHDQRNPSAVPGHPSGGLPWSPGSDGRVPGVTRVCGSAHDVGGVVDADAAGAVPGGDEVAFSVDGYGVNGAAAGGCQLRVRAGCDVPKNDVAVAVTGDQV